MKRFGKAEIEHVILGTSRNYTRYQRDPVKFGQVELGELYPKEIKQLMMSVRDNEVTVAKSCNAFGKSFTAARLAVWFYKVFPMAKVFTAAAPPERNLKTILWGEIEGICQKHPGLFVDDKIKEMNISAGPEHFIVGLTIPTTGSEKNREARFSGRHAPYMLFIVDEGDAVPDEVYRGIESCMSGGHVRLLVMFNPRDEIGEVYRMERDQTAHIVKLCAFNHPNVITGNDIIPGAVTREKTVRRINEWCRPLVQDEEKGVPGTFELPRYLVGSVALNSAKQPYSPLPSGWYKIMDPAFSYMVLGEYPAQSENQLISREWLAKARIRWDNWVAEHGELPPSLASARGGLDVAEEGADSNCLIYRFGGYVTRPVLWGGVDALRTGEKAAEIVKQDEEDFIIEVVNVDGTGYGAAAAPILRKNGIPAVGIKMSQRPTLSVEQGKFKNIRDQMLWSVREWLKNDDTAMLPPDELLLEELRCFTYRTDEQLGYLTVMKREDVILRIGRSADRAMALSFTFAPKSFFDECIID